MKLKPKVFICLDRKFELCILDTLVPMQLEEYESNRYFNLFIIEKNFLNNLFTFFTYAS